MDLTRSTSRLELARAEPRQQTQGDDSVADLATRLAQESAALVGVELRRLTVEVRHRGRDATRAVVSGVIAGGLAIVGMISLAGGSVLYLGRMWQDYAAGAFATGVLFMLFALATTFVLISAMRCLTRTGGEPSAGADAAPERSPSDGT